MSARKMARRMTLEECDAEIQFYNEQLELLDETSSNDILLDYLDKLEADNKKQKALLRVQLDKRLENNRKFSDFQLQAITDQVGSSRWRCMSVVCGFLL